MPRLYPTVNSENYIGRPVDTRGDDQRADRLHSSIRFLVSRYHLRPVRARSKDLKRFARFLRGELRSRRPSSDFPVTFTDSHENENERRSGGRRHRCARDERASERAREKCRRDREFTARHDRERETRARFLDFASKATASGEGERKRRREPLLYDAWRDDTETLKEEDNKNARGDPGAPVSFARADLSSALESRCFPKRR